MRSEHDHFPFLDGGGVSGNLARSVDWARTPLGRPDGWPQSLKTIVGVILQSRHPMFLWWGPELIQVYNDAYLPSFGAGKHPAAMGQRGRDCWQEIWPNHLAPDRRRDEPAAVELERGPAGADIPQRAHRGGLLDVRLFTRSRRRRGRRRRAGRLHRDDYPGDRCQAESNHALARRADRADHRFHGDAGRRAIDALQEARATMFRSRSSTATTVRSRALRLVRAAGLADPAAVDATVRARLGPSPFGDGEPRAEMIPCDGACELPSGVWPEPASALFLVPVSPSGRRSSTDVIVFGLSPRLPFDDGYRNHLTQIANHLGFAQAQINEFRIQAAADSERNNLLLQAPVGTALLSGPEHVFRLANPLFCRMVRRDDLVGKPYLGGVSEGPRRDGSARFSIGSTRPASRSAPRSTWSPTICRRTARARTATSSSTWSRSATPRTRCTG